MTTKKRMRCISALKRLEAQLKSGVKPEKINGKTIDKTIPLSEKDKERINKDIQILKSKGI